MISPEEERRLYAVNLDHFESWIAPLWLRMGVWTPNQAALLFNLISPDDPVIKQSGGSDLFLLFAESYPEMRQERTPAEWVNWAVKVQLPIPRVFTFLISSDSLDDSHNPAERRRFARALLDENGGNKSAVARLMGISRQRVDQLLKVRPAKTASPLQLKAQDPFNLARPTLRKSKRS